MSQLSALLLCYAGCTGLALAQDQHHRQVAQQRLSDRKRRLLRSGGWLGLFASLTSYMHASGVALGIVHWTGAFTLAALVLSLLITYRARAIVPSLAMAWLAGSIGSLVFRAP
jgi:hypothetical protein